jgi:Ca-activated chloride channel family protein
MRIILTRSLVAATALLAALAGSSTVPRAAQSAREGVMFVSAVDREGEPVPNLGPDAFQIREDGVRREVLRVSRATEPIDIAVLVDNSAAVSDDITFLRSALSKFVAKMAPGNQVALIALADRPTILVDYTNDTKRLSDAVNRLFPMSQSGMTLLDGIFETTRGLGKRETPRAVIVPVFTDGIEFTNRYSKDIAAGLQSEDVALHMVGIGQFYHSEDHSTRERSFLLDEGPRKSGGQLISLLSPHGLDDALQRLARELSSQYKVVYGRPESLIAPERAEVSSARAGVTMRGARARGESGA